MLADLHNHSCLSPCADLAMSPATLAREAAARGISILALTDHNSARNTPAFKVACEAVGMSPLFGMEITTSEECHVLAIFDSVDQAMLMNDWVFAALPPIPLKHDYFGDQPVVDEHENIVELIDILLTTAIEHPLDVIRQKTHELGGLFIPSHINRHAFSIESQLGFLPPGDYDAIEVLAPNRDEYRKRFPHLPVITASDAHTPEQIGTHPFELNSPYPTTIDELRTALKTLALNA